MHTNTQGLSSEAIQMIISSVTGSGQSYLSELRAERLLNAIARVQSGVPTGVSSPNRNDVQLSCTGHKTEL